MICSSVAFACAPSVMPCCSVSDAQLERCEQYAFFAAGICAQGPFTACLRVAAGGNGGQWQAACWAALSALDAVIVQCRPSARFEGVAESSKACIGRLHAGPPAPAALQLSSAIIGAAHWQHGRACWQPLAAGSVRTTVSRLLLPPCRAGSSLGALPDQGLALLRCIR